MSVLSILASTLQADQSCLEVLTGGSAAGHGMHCLDVVVLHSMPFSGPPNQRLTHVRLSSEAENLAYWQGPMLRTSLSEKHSGLLDSDSQSCQAVTIENRLRLLCVSVTLAFCRICQLLHAGPSSPGLKVVLFSVEDSLWTTALHIIVVYHLGCTLLKIGHV